MKPTADAVYRCQYKIAGQNGQVTTMVDTESRRVPFEVATHRDEVAVAVWSLWRSLVPYHNVVSITVIGVDIGCNGRWQAQPLQHCYSDDELRALSPAGSDYAV